jgi:hypothetical protein
MKDSVANAFIVLVSGARFHYFLTSRWKRNIPDMLITLFTNRLTNLVG